jgi:large subunit ribosomal protein L22
MSKSKRERGLADNEAKAVARMLRVSPQKLNLVAQLIRGRKASAALADLQFSRKRIAVDVKKCLESRTITISMSTIWSSPRPMSATAS